MNKYKYFKVSDLILDADIKRSELWVYLTHCRCRGIKTKGYSIAGLKKMKEIFGNKANKRAYDKSIKSLTEKDLIKEVDAKEKGINTAFYKTDIAIEIVEPKDVNSIQVPTDLLDSKLITDMNVDEILTIIDLYKNYKPLESLGGVDVNFINAYESTSDKGYYQTGTSFGERFNRSLQGKKAIAINYFDEIDTEIDNDILTKIIDRGLFRFKPVVVESYPDDDDLFELKYEIFKNLVNFKGEEYEDIDYMIAELGENQSVMWILEPLYRPSTVVCSEYISNMIKAEQREKFLYIKPDLMTDRKHTRYALYDEEVYIELEDSELVDGNTLDTICHIKEELDTITDDEVFEIYTRESELESLYKQEEEEEKRIKENNDNETRAGNRTRETTSPRLKAIIKKQNIVHDIIFRIRELEKELLDLIPYKAIEVFMYKCTDSYESENEGRVSRLIER